MSLHGETYERRLVWRHRLGQLFEWLCRLATLGALATLFILLASILGMAFTPGRGKGPSGMTIADSNVSPETVYKLGNVQGGRFELESEPGKRITTFTAADVQKGQVVFNYDGRPVAPLYDVTITAPGQDEQKLTKVGRSHADNLVPVIQKPPAAKPWGWLTWKFITNPNSYDPLEAGIMAGLWGSVWLIVLTAFMAVPLGIGAAVYLEEYSKPTLMTRLIQLNIANLAGVPSIVYGILGFTVFSRMFGMFDKEKTVLSINLLFSTLDIQLPLGPVLLSGACTLALLSLPVIIISSQEALRAVPGSLRHASLALGATKWQTIWHQVLPAALPGILTGVILSLSRAIGEAAPLAVIGVAAQISYAPGRITGVSDVVQHPDKIVRAPFDRFTALPIQVYSWINEAASNFEHVAAAGILVLLATLLTMNGFAIFIRQRFQQKIRW